MQCMCSVRELVAEMYRRAPTPPNVVHVVVKACKAVMVRT